MSLNILSIIGAQLMGFAHDLEDILSSDRLRNFDLNLRRRRVIEQNSPVDNLDPSLGEAGELDQRLIRHTTEIAGLNLAKYAVKQPIVSTREGKQIGPHAMRQEQSDLLAPQAQDLGYLMRRQIQQLANLVNPGATQGQVAHEPELPGIKFGKRIVKFDPWPLTGERLDDAMFDIALVS